MGLLGCGSTVNDCEEAYPVSRGAEIPEVAEVGEELDSEAMCMRQC